MEICKSCLTTNNHPFTPSIQEQKCRLCKVEAISQSDLIVLKDIIQHGTKRPSHYDCIIPLKGTPEDFFVVKTIIDLGFYPLCVFVNSYMANDIAWKNVHNLIYKFDVELRTFNPNPTHYKKLVRYSLRRFGDVLTPHKMLVYCFVAELARSLDINVVISGENQVQECVGKFIGQIIPRHTSWSVMEHDAHTTAADFFGPSLDLTFDISNQYNPQRVSGSGLEWLHLSDFMCWDQLYQDIESSNDGAYGQAESTTFDFYQRAGSSVFYQIHDLLRYKKFGSIKATDQLSREIRKKRINLAEAKVWNQRFISETLNPERAQAAVELFFDWLGIGQKSVKWFLKHHIPVGDPSDPKSNHDAVTCLRSIMDGSLIVNEKNIIQPKKNFCIYEKGVSI
jgi:hypothetical protein